MLRNLSVALGVLALVVDQSQDFREQPPWNRHLGHLKRDIATVPDHPRADLDQLLAQRGQRPVLRLVG